MAAIDDLKREVEENGSAVESLKTLVRNIKTKLDEAIAGGVSDARIKELADTLQSRENEIAEFVLANTPADPEQPTEP